ncbi:MAG: tetratricopeptide repeat protein [Acidiphilium sp.]
MIDAPQALRRAACSFVLLLAVTAGARAGTAMANASPYGASMAGDYAVSIGDEAAAAHYFGAALAADPGNRTLLRQAFVATLLARNPDVAALAAKLGADPLAVMVRANAAMAAGKPEDAAHLLGGMPKSGVVGLARPLLLAWAEAGAGRYGDAVTRLKSAAAGPGFGPVDTLNAALIADLAGREAEAQRLYAAAATAMPTPNLRLAQALASFQARQGNTERAAAILADMAAHHPDLALALPALERDAAKPMIGSAKDGMAETYLTLAGTLDQPNEQLLRRILLGFALELRPDLSSARMLLAALDIKEHKPHRAAAALAAVGPDDALHAPATLQRAQILAGLNKGTTALPALAALAQAHKHDAAALTLAGDIERAAKHYRKAIGLYGRAFARLGPNPPPGAWAILYGRAIAEDKLGDWPKARADLHRALSLSPGQPYVLNYLGYSEALRGKNLPAAQKMIEQALAVDPNEGAIIDSLGYTLLREGKIGHAMRVQIRAVHLAPDDAEVNAHLADIFYASGNRLAARNQWARALALHPDAKEKARILARLKRAGMTEGS